jgi:hypothetical protein
MELIMVTKKQKLVVAVGAAMLATAAYAATQLDYTDPIELSNQAPDLGIAFKSKLSRLGNGTLIAVYGDGVDANNIVYDVKGDKDRPARDIFVRTCTSATIDCSMEANWSAPLNISGTATLSSIDTDWDGDTDMDNTRKPFYGDSDKPNIGNAGNRLAVTWGDKYCPDGDPTNAVPDATVQRSVSYLLRDNREVPFSCVYVAYSSDSGTTWSTPVQLTDALRDVKQDASKGASDGKWIITWQEDPLGLLLGEGDGPGDGASGAKVSHGTDAWYTTTAAGWDGAMDDAVWAIPLRLTDNATSGSASGNHDVIRDPAGNIVADNDIDGGTAGASRPNVALVGTTAIVAYEETKGSSGLDEGKFVRYHDFVYNGGANDDPGCIISDPMENARRVRFVTQTTPGANSDTTMGIFFKQGNFDQGGPSDILLRRGVTDFTPANMVPAVDAGCATSDYNMAIQLNNMPGLNLSSETPTATTANLADSTDANNIENALAHRALLRGDDLYVGWSYTPDWAVATFTTLENYNFWLRHYDGATGSWTSPVNLSKIADKGINVREPRLVGTPTGAGQNTSAFVVAWGTQTNVPSHIGGAQDLEIFYTRTFDKGVTFEPVTSVPNPNNNARFESQLRPTPDGEIVYMVWNEEGSVNTMFSIGTSINTPIFFGGGGGSSGCTIIGNSTAFDPVLLTLVLLALGYLGLRRINGWQTRLTRPRVS